MRPGLFPLTRGANLFDETSRFGDAAGVEAMGVKRIEECVKCVVRSGC
jgi:hypothetical protein